MSNHKRIGPSLTDNVWLAGCWGRKAHRLEADEKTPCGRRIMRTSGRGIQFLGEIVRWDSLDHQRMDLCKVCWRGYEPVYNTSWWQLVWFDEHNKLLAEIMSEALVVASVPHHLDEFKVDGPGGVVVHEGTMLNYETLKSMLRIMMEEETHRKESRARMTKMIDALRTWESTHPFGGSLERDEDYGYGEVTAEIEAG